jgi:hypothetical protein
MSILSKDWRSVVLDVASAMALPTQTKVTTVTYPPATSSFGTSVPMVQAYPNSPAVTGDVGIRLATSAEVESLKGFLYPGISATVQASLAGQLLYTVEMGKPLMVTQAAYIAGWYGESGLGYYVFIGYDPANHPTQNVVLTR